jgi:AcrR family transcriptional regulator
VFKTKPSRRALASKPARGPSRAEPGTAERILDAAEKLFAESGYDGVSLRAITAEAGVELALANYHFGPKLDLFRAVVRRRAEALNAERLALLRALDADAPIEALIHAFTAPFLEKSARGGAGWKNYARLIAQTANSPRWTRDIMAAEFDPVAEAFLARVRALYPRASDDDIYWSFHFLVGAITITVAETGRVELLSGGRCKARDLDAIHARMIPFLAAGFTALCAEDPV